MRVLGIPDMLSTYFVVVLLLLVKSCVASELQQSSTDVETFRGLGLEEVVLFVLGLGVASALGLAIVVGPLFALFYTTVNSGVNGGSNTISTTVGGSRIFEESAVRKNLLSKLTEGLNVLDEALKKYGKI